MASSGRQQARKYFLWILPMKMRLVEIVKNLLVVDNDGDASNVVVKKFLTEAASLSGTKE